MGSGAPAGTGLEVTAPRGPAGADGEAGWEGSDPPEHAAARAVSTTSKTVTAATRIMRQLYKRSSLPAALAVSAPYLHGPGMEHWELMSGTKLVFILVGGALATVLIFQALNEFT